MQIVSGQNAFCSQSKELKHIDGRRKIFQTDYKESHGIAARDTSRTANKHRPKVVHVIM